MPQAQGAKFIARNRAPRVQIEYDVEVYGAEKKVQLPFVMGVLADLSGQPAEPLAPVADRKFLDIDVDNFDEGLAHLRAKNVNFITEPFENQGNRLVFFTDLDGNYLHLIARPKPLP